MVSLSGNGEGLRGREGWPGRVQLPSVWPRRVEATVTKQAEQDAALLRTVAEAKRGARGRDPLVSEQILPHENGTVDLLVEIADDPAPEMEGRPKPQSEFSADGGSGKSEISSEALPPIIATANTVSDAIGETRDLARGELEKAEGLREIEKRMRRRRQYPEGKD